MKIKKINRAPGILQTVLLLMSASVSLVDGADIVSSGDNSEVFEANGIYHGSDLRVGTDISSGSLVITNGGYGLFSNLTIRAAGTVSLYDSSYLDIRQSLSGAGAFNWVGGTVYFLGDTLSYSLSVPDGGTLELQNSAEINDAYQVTVGSGGLLYKSSSVAEEGDDIVVAGGDVVIAGGSLEGGLNTFSSGWVGIYNGAVWNAGSSLSGLTGDATVEVRTGGDLYTSDTIGSDLNWRGGSVHLQGGTHDTVYGMDTASSIYGGNLYVESNATVNAGTLLKSMDTEARVYVNGGTLNAAGLDGDQASISSGTVNLSAGSSGNSFIEMTGGTVNLNDGFLELTDPGELSLSGGTINVNTGATWFVGDSLGDINDNAEVVLNGGSLSANSLDAADFMWVAGYLGVGTVYGDLTVNGILGVGNTEITGDFFFDAGDELLMTFNNTLQVDGVASIDGGTLSLTGFGSVTNGTVIDLFDWSGGISGTFDTILIDGVAVDEEQWDLSALYSGGSIQSVPEPTTVLLMLFGGGVALLARLKQRF